MSTTTPYEYTELDKATRLNAINARIKDLEQQHLTIQLRVEAPSVNDMVSDADKQNLEMLQNSLKYLRDQAASLS